MFNNLGFRILGAIAFFILGLNFIRFGITLNPPINPYSPIWQISNGLVELEWEIGRVLVYLILTAAGAATLYGVLWLVGWICSLFPEKATQKDEALSRDYFPERVPIRVRAAPECSKERVTQAPEAPPVTPLPMQPTLPSHPSPSSPYAQELKLKAISELLGRNKK